MRNLIKIKSLSIILLMLSNFIVGLYFIHLNNANNSVESNLSETFGISPIEELTPAQANPRNQIIGSIENRDGEIFTNITHVDKLCYINRQNPNTDDQPNLFLQNWNITHARVVFENITAINYTRNIETEPTEFIISYSETEPIYVYQKFSVETDQYINNVSIFIQDVVDEDYFSDGNSWEVSIVNCSNDRLGTPNSYETLGSLKKPHPIDMVAHWEVFNFKDSAIGAIFLNKSKTNWTIIDGIVKYWFAIKIKIPPNDWRTGGGPKFLYLNPDGGVSNQIGEGETFAQSPQFINLTYNKEYVEEYLIVNGTQFDGDINSFRTYDNDRFQVESELEKLIQRVVFIVKFEFDNLTNAEYTWDDLKNIRHEEPFEWKNILNSIIFNINFSIVTNISNVNFVQSANLWMWNPDKLIPVPIYPTQINLTQQYEFLQFYDVIDPEEKLNIIQHMNTTANGNNSIIFIAQYLGTGPFNNYNISFNLLTAEVGEIESIKTIQKYDPIVHDLHYCNNVTLLNSTFNTPNNEIIESLKENDDKFLEILGDPGSNTTIIDFKFNVLTNLDSSLWDVDDPIEWIFNLPNPRIYQIDFRISSNVSIQDTSDLTHAMLEIYNGGEFAPFNGIEWIQFTDNKTFADIGENTKILPFDSYYSWYIMHLINLSENNSLRVRLRFIANGTLTGINVSIDEFSLNFHVQNAISSDITSKIGFGINSNSLKPSDIHLQNFGTDVSEIGLWEMDIYAGVPVQGFYYFNVTSIWPEVFFDVSGIYTIEKYQLFNWDYNLDFNLPKILWNVSSDISYYEFYSNLKNSQGLKFNVPSDWLLMDIYNCSISPPNPLGGWYSTIQYVDSYETITLYNISGGIWKIGMNSSKNPILFNINSTNAYIDKIINIDIEIQDIYGGDVYFEIYNANSEIIYSESSKLNETSFENSVSYNWDIFKTTKLPGIYYLKTYWLLYNKTHAYLALNTTEITVSKYTINLEILNINEFSGSYIYGTDVLIEGRLSNNDTQTVIEGEPVIAEIYDNNLNLIETKRDITNDEGIIQIEYTLPSGYRRISINLIYNASDTYYTYGESAQILTINLISQAEYYFKIFLNFLPYIGVILGISLTTIVVYKYRKSKLRKLWAGKAKILDDLLKISYIMIIHKDIGVSIYNKQISLEGIDSDLISGFLQAISQFRSEFKKESSDTQSKGFEMDYGDFKIVIVDGEFIRVALMLDGTPSEKLKESQILFTEGFERRFKILLSDFTGDITPFREADNLVEKYFNITLVYPLQLGKHYGVVKSKGLEKTLIEVAEQIQKERQFFFISSLLNFALAGRKATRDEIISTVIEMKRKGLIIPAEVM
ncbi:MAG: hypothetical protein ACFE9Q_13645 [Candidatus Hodarchaeota archaeon]